jgi:hypothetical protein
VTEFSGVWAYNPNSTAPRVILAKSASSPRPCFEPTYASIKQPSKLTPYSMALATVTGDRCPGSWMGTSDFAMLRQKLQEPIV